MPLAQVRNGGLGSFVCQSLRMRLKAKRTSFLILGNHVRSNLAVPAEKRNMSYQRGSLKKVHRKEGETWVLRYRVSTADGRRVEHNTPIGLVRKFPRDEDAWREVDRLGILIRINDAPTSNRIRFDALAEHYLKADFGADAVRPKSENSTTIMEHLVRDYLIDRWGQDIAEDIKPLAIQRWLKSLTNPLHHTLVLTCAATALRSSEILALRWEDILWLEEQIRVSKRWIKGMDGETKTAASDGYVPLHPVLANHLRWWRNQTPYREDRDFVFPSLKAKGRVPLSSSVFVADYLRPAAKPAEVQIHDRQRFGLHNLRHSLSNWLVNKARVDPKTVQGILRHSRIQTTLDLYTQNDGDEARGAQGKYLKAMGVTAKMVQ